MKRAQSFVFYLVILLSILVTANFTSAQVQVTNSNWVGTYSYEQVLRRKSNSGYADSIEYSLVVTRKGDSYFARFTADGLQTADDYECTVKANDERLDIYFLKNSGTDNGFDRGLKKGDLVGSLIKKTVRGRLKYIFQDKIFFGSKFTPVFKKIK